MQMAKSLFFMLNVVGCNPMNQDKSALIRCVFMATATTFFLALITIRAVLSLKAGITFESVEGVLNFFLLFQVSASKLSSFRKFCCQSDIMLTDI